VRAVERLQGTPDPAAAGGPLGTSVIADVARMQQQGAPIETARAAAFQQLKLTLSADPAGGKAGADDRASAVAKIAAAMAGAAVPEPGMLSEGKVAHTEIGLYYASLNPPTLVDPTLIAVVRMAAKALRLTTATLNTLYAKLPEEMLESLKVRPDILDLGKLQVYEIKSFDSSARAVPEMLDYIALLESFAIPGFTFHPGSPTNPGTAGALPVPDGWVVFCSPVPGAIIYRTILKPENPRAARERLQNYLSGASNLAMGVENMTAITVMLALGFGELLALLGEGAAAAGQPVPAIVQGAAQGGRVLGGPGLVPGFAH